VVPTTHGRHDARVPDLLGPEDEVRLDAIGFTCPLRAFYATSGLAQL